MVQSSHDYGGLPYPVAIMGTLLFCAINQHQFFTTVLAIGLLAKKARMEISPSCTPLKFALLYTALDWLIPRFWQDSLGHSLYQSKWIIQLADVGGVSGLTFFILATNGLVYSSYKSFKSHCFKKNGAVLAGLWATVLLYGGVRYHQIERHYQQSYDSVQLSLIQANIGNIDKVASEAGNQDAVSYVIGKYLKYSKLALEQIPRPEILVWPETSFPGVYRAPMYAGLRYQKSKIELFMESEQINMIVGAYDQRLEFPYNSIYFVSPFDQPHYKHSPRMEIYHKHIPIPFVEYIPGIHKNQFFADLFPQMGFFGFGPGPMVVKNKTASGKSFNLFPIICYEALFSGYNLNAVELKADALLNVTNDSWFGKYGEPYLHFALTVLRSVETRIPHIRATNTGISAMIDALGNINNPSEVYSEGIIPVTLPLVKQRPITLIALWGNWIGPLCLLIILYWLVLGWSRQYQRLKKK